MTPPTSPFHVSILTLVPEIYPGPLGASVIGKALEDGKWSLEIIHLRDFSKDKHKTVDDVPFGGGPGMVIKPDIVHDALLTLQNKPGPLLYLSPRGTPLTQNHLKKFSQESGLRLICGRFEGIDQRVLDHWDIEEISLGDFVLTGGDLPAMAMIDGCVRLLPGVLGDDGSSEDESFSNGLLEYPHYTRPREFEGQAVPDVLLSGHHKKIQEWRKQKSLEITQARRPDLLTNK